MTDIYRTPREDEMDVRLDVQKVFEQVYFDTCLVNPEFRLYSVSIAVDKETPEDCFLLRLAPGFTYVHCANMGQVVSNMLAQCAGYAMGQGIGLKEFTERLELWRALPQVEVQPETTFYTHKIQPNMVCSTERPEWVHKTIGRPTLCSCAEHVLYWSPDAEVEDL